MFEDTVDFRQGRLSRLAHGVNCGLAFGRRLTSPGCTIGVSETQNDKSPNLFPETHAIQPRFERRADLIVFGIFMTASHLFVSKTWIN
jgi:hypothetical protein